MKVIDLSQTVSEKSLIYPGDKEKGSGFELREIESMEKGDEVNGEAVSSGLHVMTHVDSPGHQVEGGKTLEEYPAGRFIGEALCLDMKKGENYLKKIEKNDLEPFQEKIEKAEILLIRTGFDEFVENYEKSEEKTKIEVSDLPSLTQESANWLSQFKNLSLLGTDSLTVGNKEVHGALLKKDILLIEGLYLKTAPENFLFCCFPWKLKNANGAPCRAIALIN